ncbi:MAG: hypothetical protein ACAI43_26350 [Phycisphaerae bacterium]
MRLLATILAAISLVLCLTACFFWVRSYGAYEGVVRFTPSAAPVQVTVVDRTKAGVTRTGQTDLDARLRGFVSHRGQLTYASIADPRPLFVALGQPEPAPWETWRVTAGDPVAGPAALLDPARERTGVTFGSGVNDKVLSPGLPLLWNLPFSYVTCPYWLLTLVLALPPYLWWSNYRVLAKREREGRCLRCGKPLNGADTCPNCKARVS